MATGQSGGERRAQLRTLPVEIVVSVSRISPRILPGFHILHSINITHWGLKIGPGYHDLKMRGLYRAKPGVAFAASLAARDERPISKSIFIGRTHFSNEEVEEFAIHRIEHAPWYHFWINNCQSFAVNQLASFIMCAKCSNNEPNFSSTANLHALSYISRMRYFEILTFTEIVATKMVAWCFGLLMTTQGSVGVLCYQILRFIGTLCQVLLALYYTEQGRTQIEEDEINFPDGTSGLSLERPSSMPTTTETASDSNTGLQRSTPRSDTLQLANDNIGTVMDPVKNIDDTGAERSHDRSPDVQLFLLHHIIIVMVGSILLDVLPPSSLNPLLICLATILTTWGLRAWAASAGITIRFPFFQPSREGRRAFDGPCETCCMFWNLRSSRTLACDHVQLSHRSNVSALGPDMNLHRSLEEQNYLAFRAMVVLVLHMFKDSDRSLLEHIHLQLSTQFLLNVFAPITPFGNFVTNILWIGYHICGGLLMGRDAVDLAIQNTW